MLTRENAINKTRQFLSECKSLPLRIDKAILFGSFANGNANENSDIDLALFSDKFSDNILDNLDIIGLVNIRYPDIDVHAYPTSYYKKNGILMEQIRKTGIEIAV